MGDAWEDPASEPVESPAPTPRKRSAAGTPGSKRQKTGASAKASPKRTPKRATSTKKTATPKASELRRSPRLARSTTTRAGIPAARVQEVSDCGSRRACRVTLQTATVFRRGRHCFRVFLICTETTQRAAEVAVGCASGL